MALALAPAAFGATTTTTPLPNVLTGPAKQLAPTPRATSEEVIQTFLDWPKVHAWLERYPPSPRTQATFKNGTWTVDVWSGRAG
jgi:hypothetical protein